MKQVSVISLVKHIGAGEEQKVVDHLAQRGYGAVVQPGVITVTRYGQPALLASDERAKVYEIDCVWGVSEEPVYE